MKKTISLFLVLALALSLAACGGQTAQSPAPTPTAVPESPAAEAHYPVTITSYNENGETYTQTFDQCPERVVSISQANTELLLALGLRDKIIATAHRFSPVYEPLAEEYNSIPFIAEKGYPARRWCWTKNPT